VSKKLLQTVFVNDLDSDVVNKVWKFADDVKMIGNVGTVEGVREFRKDLTRVEKWAEVLQMGFSVDKCKVMGLGHRKECLDHALNGKHLKRVREESD